MAANHQYCPGPCSPDLLRGHDPPPGMCVDSRGVHTQAEAIPHSWGVVMSSVTFSSRHPTQNTSFMNDKPGSDGLGEHVTCRQDRSGWDDHATPLRPGACLGFPWGNFPHSLTILGVCYTMTQKREAALGRAGSGQGAHEEERWTLAALPPAPSPQTPGVPLPYSKLPLCPGSSSGLTPFSQLPSGGAGRG